MHTKLKTKKKKPFFASLILLSVLAAGLFSGCDASKSVRTAEEVYNQIQAAFTEAYGTEAITNAPMEIDDVTLEEKFHLSPGEVESYRGVIAGMMTNCDELLVVKAKEGGVEDVCAALEQALAEQKEAFGWYAVMHNVERLDAAKVVTEGDFAALLIVGISPEDDTDTVDFTADVSLAEDAFRRAAK